MQALAVLVQEAAFSAAEELERFQSGLEQSGAVVSFTGIVRNNAAGDLEAMEIEHYPAMTEQALRALGEQAMARWPLERVLVLHRFGRLALGAPIMMVATASAHRAAAFEAADFLMDYLKSRAPFWKKEITQSGSAWVAAKEADEAALERW